MNKQQLNRVLKSNGADQLRKRFECGDEEIIKTEVFRLHQYDRDCSIANLDGVDFEQDVDALCSLFDNYLRANVDEDVIKISLEDATEYILRRAYSCNSRNEYDYAFIFDNLFKEAFIKRCIDNNVVTNLEIVGDDYYLFVDSYTLNNCFELRDKYSEYVPF